MELSSQEMQEIGTKKVSESRTYDGDDNDDNDDDDDDDDDGENLSKQLMIY